MSNISYMKGVLFYMPAWGFGKITDRKNQFC